MFQTPPGKAHTVYFDVCSLLDWISLLVSVAFPISYPLNGTNQKDISSNQLVIKLQNLLHHFKRKETSDEEERPQDDNKTQNKDVL